MFLINHNEFTNITDEGEEIEDDNFSASRYQLFILAGVYLACSILSAVVVALFVDPLSKYVLNSSKGFLSTHFQSTYSIFQKVLTEDNRESKEPLS